MTGPSVVSGAGTLCSMGMAPSTLIVPALPGRPLVQGRPAATITDIAPMANIVPFGMCQSLANPAVATATAAALGTLTPMPCVPVIAGPWAPPAARTQLAGVPGLTAAGKCQCLYGGTISITMPGNTTVMIA